MSTEHIFPSMNTVWDGRLLLSNSGILTIETGTVEEVALVAREAAMGAMEVPEDQPFQNLNSNNSNFANRNHGKNFKTSDHHSDGSASFVCYFDIYVTPFSH